MGGKVGGRCLATVLAATLQEDPGAQLKLELIDGWPTSWKTAPEIHAGCGPPPALGEGQRAHRHPAGHVDGRELGAENTDILG